jgi:hypothetical protein
MQPMLSSIKKQYANGASVYQVYRERLRNERLKNEEKIVMMILVKV